MMESYTLLCVPEDRSQLPQCQELDDVVVTDLYVKDACHLCGQAIWVGPRQMIQYQLNPGACELVCFVCALRALQLVGSLPEIAHLGGGSNVEGSPLQ